MSIWKTTMTWLGLGPDSEYDQPADGQPAAAYNESAGRSSEPRPVAPATIGHTAGGVGAASDFTAVRSLGPMSDGEYRGDYPGDQRPLTNTSLRPVEVEERSEPAMGSVRPVPTSPGSRPQLVAPRSFNDAQEVADRFRSGAPVILNLQETDADLGRRVIDFCSGLCYGLRGQMQRVGDRVFLLTPADVQLSADDHRMIRDSGLLS